MSDQQIVTTRILSSSSISLNCVEKEGIKMKMKRNDDDLQSLMSCMMHVHYYYFCFFFFLWYTFGDTINTFAFTTLDDYSLICRPGYRVSKLQRSPKYNGKLGSLVVQCELIERNTQLVLFGIFFCLQNLEIGLFQHN